MAKKPRGLNAANKLIQRRRKYRWRQASFVKKALDVKKKTDPLKGSHQARAIVLEKREVEAKQPNSAKRKCAKVQLVKNGIQVTAFMPGNDAKKFINEHDEVLIECIGGAKGRSKGDIPGVKWQIIKVNGQSLKALLAGKVEKARR